MTSELWKVKLLTDDDRALLICDRLRAVGKDMTVAKLLKYTGWDREEAWKLLEAMIGKGKLMLVERVSGVHTITCFERPEHARKVAEERDGLGGREAAGR